MAKPLSMDVRERVVTAVLTDGMSARGAAARFGVSESSAIKWVRRHRETGSAAPSRIGGYKPRLLTGALRDWLRGLSSSGTENLHKVGSSGRGRNKTLRGTALSGG